MPELKGAELVEQRGRADARHCPIGRGVTHYRAGSSDYRVDHGAFFQVNRWLIDPLIERVVAQPRRQVWPGILFAGVGLFARQLARAL